ncbi:MAG: CRISPR-associated endonuclease Cas1 [Candidatus Bathyarchaeia archaeon]
MNPLLLSGWGIKVSVQYLKSRSYLTITDGRLNGRESTVTRFPPRRLPFSAILLDGFSGYLSLRAVHWLGRNGTPVYFLDVDGSLLSVLLPAAPVKADLRIGQLHSADDPEKKFRIANRFVEAKVRRSLEVLDSLAQRYDIAREVRAARLEASKLRKARTVAELRIIEGRVAQAYWRGYCKALPQQLEFQGRMTTRHNNNASDPVNAALNYGYGFLEAECRKAINGVGLEPSVGFLHALSPDSTKQSLCYDLIEPFRWLVDLSVLQAFESRVLDWSSFYFTTNDYRYRFSLESKKRFIELLKERFNSGVVYKGQRMKWDTVIQEKTSELARYLSGRSRSLDFIEPSPTLERFDNAELRERIKALTSEEAKKAGIDKSTLYTLRQHACKEPPFKLYRKTLVKLESARG